MLIENIKLAFNAMRGSKMRTALSLLGIVIGVASVVAILTIGDSASKSITESIAIGGLDMVSIYPSSGQRNTGIFDEAFGDMLRNDIEGIQAVLPQNSSTARVRNGKRVDQRLGRRRAQYLRLNVEPRIWRREFFSSMDNINRRQVIVLGSAIAEELFPDQVVVGQYVSLFRSQAKSYLVVGVLESKDPSISLSYNNSVFIPYNTYSQRFIRTNGVGSYVVKIAEGNGGDVVEADGWSSAPPPLPNGRADHRHLQLLQPSSRRSACWSAGSGS